MPFAGTRGAATAYAYGFATEVGSSAFYIGGQFNFGTSGTIASMGGAVGNFLVIFDPAGSASVTLSSGNALTNIATNFYTRVLDSADIAGTVTASGSGASVAIYRGVSSAAAVDGDTSVGPVTDQDAGGFTRNTAQVGILCTLQSTTASSTVSVSLPATFTTRLSGSTSVSSARTLLMCDRLQLANPPYVSGASIVWSSDGNSNVLRVVELRA